MGARLKLESLPLLNGAIEQLQAGIVSTMHTANSRSCGEMMQPTGSLHVAHTQILFDPQTSGGLLIALPAARAASLCTALHQHGYASARVLGEVTPLTPGHTRPVDVSQATRDIT